jgi:hypothetical protein
MIVRRRQKVRVTISENIVHRINMKEENISAPKRYHSRKIQCTKKMKKSGKRKTDHRKKKAQNKHL